MGDQYSLKLGRDACRGIDDYLEYKRIVGNDDGGKMFTPKEYEEYKKRVLPTRMENRLFVTWTSPSGMDCVCVGPETLCFCQHRFHEHKTDYEKLPKDRPIPLPCQARGCKCSSFHYVPKNRGQPLRCHCKHETPAHGEVAPFICRQRNCKCMGFKSSFTCDCGSPTYSHTTVVETKQERIARGHPVGHDVPYKAMGGLTGFSSLAAGYQRLDPSGLGAPSDEWLGQEITSSDNPFLRSQVQAITQHKLAQNDIEGRRGDIQGAMVDADERHSQMRRQGESELDFYERRYQEREKQRHQGGRAVTQNTKPVRQGQRIQQPPPPHR